MNKKLLLLIIGIAVLLIGAVVQITGVADKASSMGIIGGAILCVIYMAIDFKAVIAQIGKRSTRYGAAQTTMVVLMLGIVAFILAYSNTHSKRFDFTENKRFTLDVATKNVVEALDKEVRIVCFNDSIAEQMWQQATEDLLKQYVHLNDKISYKFIDPLRNPKDAMDYKNELYTMPTIFVEQGVTREKAKETSLDMVEEGITNAIIKVTRTKENTVYFLAGHGEADYMNTSDFHGFGLIKQRLEAKNYTVKQLKIERSVGIPEDCSALVIAGPQTDLFDYEMKALDRYINLGGNVIVMLEPQSAPNFAAWAKKYGLNVGNDMICEAEFQADIASLFTTGKLSGRVSVSLNPSVSSYPADIDITRNFELITQYPNSRSVAVNDSLPEGIKAERLLETRGKDPKMDMPGSWAETDLEALISEKTAQFDPDKDIEGPVSIAALATVDRLKFAPAKAAEAAVQSSTELALAERPDESHLLVFGDSDFARNGMVARGGGDLIMNSVNFMVGEGDLITVTSKTSEDTSLTLTGSQQRVMYSLIVFVWPMIVVTLGIVVWIRRRRSG